MCVFCQRRTAGFQPSDQNRQCGGSSAYTTLDDAITAGMINTSTLDTVVLRVLQEKFALGLFDNPITDPSGLSHINSPEHVALALRAAEQGVVLLKNDGNLLPVGAPGQAATKYSAPDVAQRTVVKSIAVIGPIGTESYCKNNLEDTAESLKFVCFGFVFFVLFGGYLIPDAFRSPRFSQSSAAPS